MGSTALFIWTYRNRKGKIVLASQPTFLYVICLGTFMMGSAIFPLSIDDEIASSYGCTLACNSIFWLFGPGFQIEFSGLYCKMRKLNKIFYNGAMRRTKVKERDVIWPMAVLFVINMILLIVWTSITPLTWQRSISSVDSFDRTLSSWGFCNHQNILFPSLLVLTSSLALCLTLYEAYKARHIKTVLGETKYVAMAAGSMLLVFAMGIPIAIIANDNPRARFFINLFIIFIICISLLLFIFYPKVTYHIDLVNGGKSMTNLVKDFTEESHAYSQKKKAKSSLQSSVASVDDGTIKKVGFKLDESESTTVDLENQNIEALNQENESLKQQLEHQKSQVRELQRLLYSKSNDDNKEFVDEPLT